MGLERLLNLETASQASQAFPAYIVDKFNFLCHNCVSIRTVNFNKGNAMLGTLKNRNEMEETVRWESVAKNEQGIENDAIATESPDTMMARVGPIHKAGNCEYRAFAVCVGNKVYICPVWSSLEMEICHEKGFVFFIWHPTQEGYQNVCWGNVNRYAVVFCPDGRVEEFKSISAHAPKLQVIGDHMFSIRPEHWADESRTTTEIDDRLVAVWNGTEGPPMHEIRYVVESRGVPVYFGRMGGRCWNEHLLQSTKVVIRHPDTGLMTRYTLDWCLISKTPKAGQPRKTFRGISVFWKLSDGSVVWGTDDGNGTISVFHDGRLKLQGDMLAFHKRKRDGVLTVIQRLPRNRRRVYEMGKVA